MNAEMRLKELGIELPKAAAPAAMYIPVCKVGRFVFTAGQGPLVNDKPAYNGKVGQDLSIEEGQAAARICAINILAAAKRVVALDKIKKVIKVNAFVNSAQGFSSQHLVANGASEVLVSVFGEAGQHPRTAVGVPELPLNVPVEVEAIFEIEDEEE